MSALTDLKASTARVQASVDAAIADIKTLADKLTGAVTGTPDADVEAAATELNAIADRLDAAVNPPPGSSAA